MFNYHLNAHREFHPHRFVLPKNAKSTQKVLQIYRIAQVLFGRTGTIPSLIVPAL